MKRVVALFAGPLAFLLIEVIYQDDPLFHVFAVLSWMLIWWMTEVVNLAVTALLPLVLFPLLGVATLKEISVNYSHPIVFLFFGGFVLALAIEKWDLHKRIALSIIQKTGIKSRQVLLGFMIATAFLSMWISNTATTIMMLPIALSVLNVIQVNKKQTNKIGFLLLVSIAWSANIGGVMTLIGTPPNLILLGFLRDQLGQDIAFAHWLLIGIPTGITLLGTTYFVMSRFLPDFNLFEGGNIIDDELQALGKMKTPEKRVAIVFFLTALAWIIRPLLVKWFKLASLSDTHIALICAILLFLLPSGDEKENRILKWNDTSKLAWGILILFGGGLALASAINSSGALELIESYLSSLEITSILVLIAIIAFIGIFVTELVSNMALVAATLPLVLAISKSMNVDFLVLALPLTLGASCAFMFPMATPPNAIVFSSGKIKIEKMARYGLMVNALAFVIITFFSYYLGGLLL
jgi:sodium-dependent dicarboxylate transporter 2/3/5